MLPNNDIIRKIQKLLNLANNPNEQEASAAMGKAQELLAKYNLEFATVKEAQVQGGIAQQAAPEKREKTKMNRSAQYLWQRKLWSTLAESNFCFHWITHVYEGKRGNTNTISKVAVKRHMILGRESNVIAVRLMGEYLEDTMEQLLPYPNKERLSRAAISWKSGCTDRLCKRIEEKFNQMKDPGADGPTVSTALVLRDVVQAEYEANYDVQHGAGAWLRRQEHEQEWKANREKRDAAYEAKRLEEEQELLRQLQAETPADKRARERKEQAKRLRQERANERSWRTYYRQQARENNKRDWEAYAAGSKTGAKINLGPQTEKAEERRQIK